jgi:hypothetical protein
LLPINPPATILKKESIVRLTRQVGETGGDAGHDVELPVQAEAEVGGTSPVKASRKVNQNRRPGTPTTTALGPNAAAFNVEDQPVHRVSIDYPPLPRDLAAIVRPGSSQVFRSSGEP